MKISVVIPAYNEEKYIKKALKSVIGQSVAPDEIIVVNNNSTDRTPEIVEKFKGVKLINENKQGMIPARNKGFNSAQFDIIARIDSDVQVPPDWIKRIKNNFDKGKIDALTGPIILSDSKSKIIAQSLLPSHIYIESLKIISGGVIYLMGPNMSLSNEMWQKVKSKINLNDKRVHEDLDLSLKIIEANGIIRYDKKLPVYGSVRRMDKHPESFFIEYPIRVMKTFIENKDVFKSVSKKNTKKGIKLLKKLGKRLDPR